MDWLQDRRLQLAVGGGVLALLASLALALALVGHNRQSHPAASPASVGGLVVQMGPPSDTKLDPKELLRCFVNGQYIGDKTLADCAKMNGVATKALDVGVGPDGADQLAGANLAPPPPSDAASIPASGADQPPAVAGAGLRGVVGDCR